MDRKRLLDFIGFNSRISIVGDSRDRERFCWWLSENGVFGKKTGDQCVHYDACAQVSCPLDTGMIILSEQEYGAEEEELYKAGYKNVCFVSKWQLRELRFLKTFLGEEHKKQALQLLEAYENGTLNSSLLADCTYAALAYIKFFRDIEVYKSVFRAVCICNWSRIHGAKKRKAGFLIKHSSEWSAESLYRYLEQDERYEVSVFVAPYFVGTEKSILDNYRQSVSYFQNKADEMTADGGGGYRVVAMYDESRSSGHYLEWNQENQCDIMFHLSPAFVWLKGSSCIVEFPLSTVNIYIPYGFYISGFVETAFNQLSHAMFWRVYCESEIHREMAKRYADLGDWNVAFSGYLKMDAYYENKKQDQKSVWKIPETDKKGTYKCIIYAPHWSIGQSKTAFGSFDQMYEQMYELAEKTGDCISWIIKPHPRLRSECVVQGVFQTEEEYDQYLEKWNSLPNARAVSEGTYDHIFLTSDGMVLDSISFLAEYLYVHRPMIFLTRSTQTVNEFGEKLLKVLYCADSTDFSCLTDQIDQIIRKGEDEKKDQREKFFEQYLDFNRINGKAAWQFIADQLEEAENCGNSEPAK